MPSVTAQSSATFSTPEASQGASRRGEATGPFGIIQWFVVQVPCLPCGRAPRAVASTSTKPNFLVMVRAGSWPSVISWVTATSSRGSVPGSCRSASMVPCLSSVPYRSMIRSVTASSSGWPGASRSAFGLPSGRVRFLSKVTRSYLAQHRGGGGAGLAVAVADVGGDVADLVAAGLAFGQPAAELLERLARRRR